MGCAAGYDGVGCFDEGIRAGRHGFGGGNKSLCPAVVFLVELGFGGGTAAFADDFLLRGCGCFDELGDGVCDCDGGFENGAVILVSIRFRDRGGWKEDLLVNLQLVGGIATTIFIHHLIQPLSRLVNRSSRIHQFLIDELAQITRLIREPALGRKRISKLG